MRRVVHLTGETAAKIRRAVEAADGCEVAGPLYGVERDGEIVLMDAGGPDWPEQLAERSPTRVWVDSDSWPLEYERILVEQGSPARLAGCWHLHPAARVAPVVRSGRVVGLLRTGGNRASRNDLAGWVRSLGLYSRFWVGMIVTPGPTFHARVLREISDPNRLQVEISQTPAAVTVKEAI